MVSKSPHGATKLRTLYRVDGEENNACQDSVLMMSGREGPAAIPLSWAT